MIFADPDLYEDVFEHSVHVAASKGNYPCVYDMICQYENVVIWLSFYYTQGWVLHERTESGVRVQGRYGACQPEDQVALNTLLNNSFKTLTA